MGPLYWEWVKQYQATDQLLFIMFCFGAVMMVGYYAARILPFKKEIVITIQKIQGAVTLAVILITLAAPFLMDAGLFTMG